MASERVQVLTDDDFDQKVAKAPRGVVIDFWAPWCDPCKLLDPILEKLAERYDGQVDFLKMNVDDATETPDKFAVRNIPTVLFFKDGVVQNQMIGVEPEEKIEEAVKSLL